MRKTWLGLVAVLAIAGAIPTDQLELIDSADAAISLFISPSPDGGRYSSHPNGDKPIVPCSEVTGWTEVDIGDAGGEICDEGSNTVGLGVTGTKETTDFHMIHKDGGGGEVQIECLITDSYAGSTHQFASTGCGIREDDTDTAFEFYCHSLQNSSASVQCSYGANGSYTHVNGAIGFARPRCVVVTYYPTSNAIKGFEGADCNSVTEITSHSRSLSDDMVYLFGSSRSTTVTLQARISNIAVLSEIDAYDEDGGNPPGGPTLTTPLPNQSGQQGVVFALQGMVTTGTIAGNFSNETSFAIGADPLPTGSGLSLNTSTGAVTGTPDADDLGTWTADLCAVNVGGTTCDNVQFTISASVGDTFGPYGSAVTVIDCNSAETTTTKGNGASAGDTILIDGVTRGALTIRDCVGQDSNRITVRPPNGEVVTIQRTGSGTSAVLQLINLENVDVDGNMDDCGMLESWPTENLVHACGFVLDLVGTSVEPTHYLSAAGTSTKFSVQSVEVNCTGGTSGIGIGIQFNDNKTFVNPDWEHDDGGDYAGEWREDISFVNNWLHGGCGGNPGSGATAMYLGPNAYGSDGCQQRTVNGATATNPIRIQTSVSHGYGDSPQVEQIEHATFKELPGAFGTALNGRSYPLTVVDANEISIPVNGTGFSAYTSGGRVTNCIGRRPHRGLEVAYNMIDDQPGSSIRIKYNTDNDQSVHPNTVHHNFVRSAGADTAGHGSDCIHVADGGSWRIYNNICLESDDWAINFSLNDPRGAPVPGGGPYAIEVYNNMIVSPVSYCVRTNLNNNFGENYSSQLVYNNTCVDPGTAAVTFDSDANGSLRAFDNIFTGDTAAKRDVLGESSSGDENNLKTTTTLGTAGFVSPGTGNYEIGASSSACNNSSASTAPATDYEDEARPLDSGDDRGADEAAACP